RDVDVRFVSATHRDIRQMVNAGTFREDLYFRLAVLPITIPPLRDRIDDIPLLVQRFLPGEAAASLRADLLAERAAKPWPGDVRQLRNFVERAVALGAREALALANPHRDASDNGANEVFPEVRCAEPFKTVRERWVNHLEREYLTVLL